MATYNGEKYIEKQIKSVLENLSEEDELIISDDGSTDATKDIIEGFKDRRIKLFDGPKKGVKKNFENAIRNCSGRYIFLCDQDDEWMPKKVDTVVAAFKEHNCPVVVHNCSVVGEDGGKLVDSFFDFKKSGPGFLKNLYVNTYIGCCMAFDASLKEKILPIPEDIEMHDQWIGMWGDLKGKNVFIDDKLIVYQRHEGNASDCFNHYSVGKMLKKRFMYIFRFLFH